MAVTLVRLVFIIQTYSTAKSLEKKRTNRENLGCYLGVDLLREGQHIRARLRGHVPCA